MDNGHDGGGEKTHEVRRFRKGKAQPCQNRLFQGCCFVLALVVVTLGPLYLSGPELTNFTAEIAEFPSSELEVPARYTEITAQQPDFRADQTQIRKNYTRTWHMGLTMGPAGLKNVIWE